MVSEGGGDLCSLFFCDVAVMTSAGSRHHPGCRSFQMSEADVNGQLESVCESVFSEVESQAMDALDLPGGFRTRSHSYLRAIQAGYSQDDERIPMVIPSDVSSTARPSAGKAHPLTFRGHVQACATSVLRGVGVSYPPNVWTLPSYACDTVLFAMMF